MAQNKKFIELRQQRDFGQVISTSFDFLFANFASLFKTVFAIAGFTFVLSMAIISLWIYKFINILIDASPMDPDFDPGVNLLENVVTGDKIGYVIAGGLFFFISMMFAAATVYCYMNIYVRNGRLTEISVREVWEEVKQKFLKYLGGGFVFYIVVNFIMIASVTISGFLYFVLGMGTLALYYYSYLYFTVIVSENVNVIDAFARSFYLVKGKWWFTVGISVVTFLLCYILSLLISVGATTIISLTRNIFDYSVSKFINGIILISFSVVSMIYTYMIYCFLIIKNSVLYYNFSEIKDNTGLLEKIHSLAGEQGMEPEQAIRTERSKQQYTNEETEEDF